MLQQLRAARRAYDQACDAPRLKESFQSLCEKAEGERGVTFKPLSEAQQRKLELTSGSSGKELTGSNAEKQHKFKSTTALFDSES